MTTGKSMVLVIPSFWFMNNSDDGRVLNAFILSWLGVSCQPIEKKESPSIERGCPYAYCEEYGQDSMECWL